MPSRINLDMDVLRTFVTGFELGSFARAAERLGRSQSAISSQLHKLEEQLGEVLFRKSGRQLELTTAGESLLGYAKRMLALNDEAVETVRGIEAEGWARLGLPEDFAEQWLPSVLSRFSLAYPNVRVEVHVDRSASLVERTIKGDLDIALVWGAVNDGPQGEQIAEYRVQWIGPPGWPGTQALNGDPLPFAAFAPPCVFRAAAIDAMDAAGVPWRLVFTSPSVAGLWAATEGGLGITARTSVNVPKSLAALDPKLTGLPELPKVPLSLYRAEANQSEAIGQLVEILRSAVNSEIG